MLRLILVMCCAASMAACGGKTTPAPPSTETPSGERIIGTERLGWDQRAADAAELATIRYAIYVDGVPLADHRAWFEDLRDGAVLTLNLDQREPETKQQAAMWQRRRDVWILERSDEAIVVGTPDDEDYQTAVQRLGDDNVFLLRT